MAIVPFANWRPVPSHSGLMVAHQGLVLHVQVGDGSCYGEFSVPANQASSTWWGSKVGVLEQYVDSDDAAWTEAAGNFTWDSIETEGVPEEPLTDEQVSLVAQVFAWGHLEYGWPFVLAETPDDSGLGWHGMGGVPWGNHPDCPGDLRKAQMPEILTLAQAIVNPPQEAPMAVAPAISFGGQKHVFQCPGGLGLQHMWSSDGKTWKPENLFTTAGIGTPSIPNQEPGVSITDSQLTVTCEDSTGRAWYFVFINGKWGVAELPVAQLPTA